MDSIPSSAGREAPVSMGMTAALKGRQVSEFTRSCLAIEVLCAAQALDFCLPVKPGRGVLAAYELHKDIEAVSQLIDSGALLAAVRSATA